MKQKIRFIIVFFVLVLLFFIPNKVFAITSLGGYNIEAYNIDMKVNENNTFDIIETITANFSGSNKHGIFRKIPLRNSVTRLDGTKSNNSAKITNISVSDPYTTSNENGNKVLKIGSSNQTVSGKKVYTIKYNYNIGKDPLKNADELYFNLIGTEWDTDIQNVTFTIIMPKEFDKTKLGFSSGNKYSSDSSNIEYIVTGNTIKGKVKTKLLYGQGLTVRLTLPEGYFVGASSNLDYWSIAKIAISFVFVIIAFALWLRNGKDDKVIDTLEFYPPEDFNSADIGFLYKGYSDNNDVISLLIYLANKGYLKIEEFEETTLKIFKSKNFKITKLKDYDGDNKDERTFFEGLFSKKEEVTRSDLYDRFYKTLNSITRNINRRENKEKIFEKASLACRIPITIMIIVLLIIMGGFESLLASIPMFGVFLIISLILLYTKPSVITTIVACASSVMCGIAGITLNSIYSGNDGIFFALEMICENISLIMLIVFLGIMRKRTQYGTEILGRINGFKNFLENAEKPRLEQHKKKKPEYFYDILPYTYVLGVSNLWMKKFEDIALEAPSWYCGYDHFDNHSFNAFMASTYSSISTAMSSSPDSGGSGGGSSGGGSGGRRRWLLVKRVSLSKNNKFCS